LASFNPELQMNTNRAVLSVVALSVSLVVLWSVFGPVAAQDKKGEPARPVMKWEYKIVVPSEIGATEGREIKGDKMEAALNKLGAEGWECVGTVSEVTGSTQQGTWTRATLICKRPKQ
jgi:hypothetical protein